MRSFSLITFASVAWLAASVLGHSLVTHDETFEPDYILRVSGQNISQACNTRYSAVVNGTSPGPELRLLAGSAYWIRVYNDLEESNVTMHWHGLAQRMAEFSDGSPLASQWPIPPRQFFDYEIQVPKKEAGTYFYHSHIGMQALTVTGALIIEDCPADVPYKYDDERTLLFSEHYPQDDHTFETGLLAAPLRFGGEVQAILLNGQGVAINHTAGELGPDDFSCQLPVVEVEAGKTYRFRFIGATSLAHSSVAFEGHEQLEVIAVDGGQYTKPAPISYLQIGSGQRFDVLFRTKTPEELAAEGQTEYWIQFETRDRPSVYRGFGILRYTNAVVPDAPVLTEKPLTPPLSLPNETYSWLEGELHPLYDDPDFPTLAEVTRTVVLDSRQLIDPVTNQTIWQENGLNWNELVAHPVPLLVDIYQRGEAAIPNMEAALANDGWDPTTRSFPVEAGEVLEIVLQNTGSLIHGGVDVHPFHTHGAHFYDVASGNGTYNATKVEEDRIAANYTPVKRDTTMLYRYIEKTTNGIDAGWRTWRWRVLDTGVWMIHCHTLQHMVMGMQTVWVIGNATDIQKYPTDLSEGYLTYGGSVYGDDDNAPQVNEQFDHGVNTCDAPDNGGGGGAPHTKVGKAKANGKL